jgi:hypothetical protein
MSEERLASTIGATALPASVEIEIEPYALAHNRGNFRHTLVTPDPTEDGLPTSLEEKLIKIGAES